MHFRALGRMKQGQLNRTEQAYSDRLARMQQMGEIKWFLFEGIKLRLADKTFYSPDFVVMNAKDQIELHEVKPRSGKSYFALDDSKVKIKCAAERFPFAFFICFPQRCGTWEKIEI